MSQLPGSNEQLLSEVERLRARVAGLEVSVSESKKREQVLRDQIAQYEAFAKINPVWFWETDEEHRFTYLSSSVGEITGLSPEWHYGKTRADIGAAEMVGPEVWLEHIETLQRQEPFTDFIFQRHGPDGVKWMSTSGAPFFDEEGVFKGYRGIGSDNTDQITTKSRVDTLMAAMEQLYETVVLWDEEDRLLVCNDRFRQVNAAVIEETKPGTPMETHFRAALAEGLYPSGVGREEEWFAERLHRHKNPGEPFEVERQDGQWILVHERRVTGGVTATISTDITNLKKVARTGREKTAILETTIETIPDGIHVLDRDFNLSLWNDQLFTILELDRDAVLQAANPRYAFFRMLAERGEYGDGDPDELVAARETYIRTKAPLHFVRQLTTGKWIEGRGIPIEGDEGYVTVYRDITERRQLDRLKREFISTVSHELRTPLTSIYGSLGLIKSGGVSLSNGKSAQLIDIAHQNCVRLVKLVNDILDIDKINAGKMEFRMEPVALSQLVSNSIALNAGFGEQFGVSFEVKGQLPGELVNGDADRLVQVLTNLLSNAAKYSPRDGVVEISATRKGSDIRVGVRDWGPGIPIEFHDRIFDRFGRADSTDSREVPGTGLGLYICKAIMDQHEGVIGFEPMAEGGTNFYFELPVVSASA